MRLNPTIASKVINGTVAVKSKATRALGASAIPAPRGVGTVCDDRVPGTSNMFLDLSKRTVGTSKIDEMIKEITRAEIGGLTS